MTGEGELRLGSAQTRQGPSPWTLIIGVPIAPGFGWVRRGATSRCDGKALALPGFIGHSF